MKLSTKHGEQQTVTVRADFTGGLNTAAQIDWIGENQLAECVNMEVDGTTAKLMTVEGTTDILSGTEIFAVVVDKINSLMLLIDNERKVRVADFKGKVGEQPIGKLSGELYPKYCEWKDGVLTASGGHLQYFNGSKFVTIDTPPADEVFVRAGRVMISHGTKIFYSGTGDERDWVFDNNRENSAKFAGVGYKDGGKLRGIESLSDNVLALKDNGRCYRIIGEYPEIQISEIAGQAECSGRRSFCATGDEVFVLGNDGAYFIQKNYYGNVRPENIAAQVKSEIQKLPPNAQVRYLPNKYQVWCIGREGQVLVYDVRFKSWFKRKFNSAVTDVFSFGNEVYIVKPDRISKLDKYSFKDNDEWLRWKFLTRRMVSHYDYLLKQMKVSVTMLNRERYCGEIFCGKVSIALPRLNQGIKAAEDDSPIYQNKTKSKMRGRILPQPPDEKIYGSEAEVFGNRHKIFADNTVELQSKNYCRSHYLDTGGQGHGGRFVLQSIVTDIAEV